MIIRQGDILLVRVGDAEQADTAPLVVGHGEVTGHKHVIESATAVTGDALAWDLFARTGEWQAEGDPLVSVPQETRITHQEHDALTIPAGMWRIVRQREYAPERDRFVAD